MFPEEGNYGHEEAISTIHMLNDLSHIMDHKKTSIFKKLKKNNYESVTEIKETLYEFIKPYLLHIMLFLSTINYFNIRLIIDLFIIELRLNLIKKY